MGVLLYGMKIIALWSLSSTALIADVVVFDQSTLFGSAGAIIIVVGTIWMTFRTNAVKYWKDTSEARAQRVITLEADLQKKSDEKHSAVAELAAERMKRDLTPVLESLVTVQQDLVAVQQNLQERQQGQHEIVDALTKISDGQLQLASGQAEQNAVLTRIVDQLETMVNGS